MLDIIPKYFSAQKYKNYHHDYIHYYLNHFQSVSNENKNNLNLLFVLLLTKKENLREM